ncbi:unnamed protein product [Bursaphelenchus xylophilus]|uniref:Large ribosomal subunit protein uL10m n=1 Tax=Bursaphelenchus xylophilus TaxID=6326 RepID=A0A1I7SW63_BURXY|nr:unnamed protein product [Bursaphelenchus xylophilus]CAG9098886.1 unnamed protein product [Bursaphelenchus xylophilus]
MSLLNCIRPGTIQCRFVSSKYLKPHPRPYKRRLFEAVIKPEMPEEITPKCIPYFEFKRRYDEEEGRYTAIELALADKVRKWIIEEKFRVFSICQFLSIKARPLHYIKNQLRVKGLEFKTYEPRIMNKVFEGTAFDVLSPLYLEMNYCLLFGRDITAVKTIVTETNRIPYIFPLAITYDDKILSLRQINELCELTDPEHIRAQTVQLLQTVPSQLTSTLDHPSQNLTFLLSNIPN